MLVLLKRSSKERRHPPPKKRTTNKNTSGCLPFKARQQYQTTTPSHTTKTVNQPQTTRIRAPQQSTSKAAKEKARPGEKKKNQRARMARSQSGSCLAQVSVLRKPAGKFGQCEHGLFMTKCVKCHGTSAPQNPHCGRSMGRAWENSCNLSYIYIYIWGQKCVPKMEPW